MILTEWSAFRAIDWTALGPSMRRRLLIDLRNICDQEEVVRQGMEYVPLGRADIEMAYRAAAE